MFDYRIKFISTHLVFLKLYFSWVRLIFELTKRERNRDKEGIYMYI